MSEVAVNRIPINQIPELYEVWNAAFHSQSDVHQQTYYKLPDSLSNPLASSLTGVQRGDEGKGEETKNFSEHAADIGLSGVALKGAGGAGTGHTFYPRGAGPENGFVFSMFPAVLHPDWKQVIGRGVLFSPERVLFELNAMDKYHYNISSKRIEIDGAAFLGWDGYAAIDSAQETSRGQTSIGTTKQGVGPAQARYTSREGMNLYDLLVDNGSLQGKVEKEVKWINGQLKALGSSDQFSVEDTFRRFKEWKDVLAPYITNTFRTVTEALTNGALIIECTQAFGLGRETGHPGSTTAVDTGLGPITRRYRTSTRYVGNKTGVLKFAETTVGKHIDYCPMEDGTKEIIYNNTKERGRPEEGSRSGRRRKLTWSSIPEIKAAIATDDLSGLVVRKMDVLKGIQSVQFGTLYRFTDGSSTDQYDPEDPRMQDPETKMDTIVIPWTNRSIDGATDFSELPDEARAGIAVFEYLVDRPVIGIGTGPRFENEVRRGGYPYQNTPHNFSDRYA